MMTQNLKDCSTIHFMFLPCNEVEFDPSIDEFDDDQFIMCPYCGETWEGHEFIREGNDHGVEECDNCLETFEWEAEFHARYYTKVTKERNKNNG